MMMMKLSLQCMILQVKCEHECVTVINKQGHIGC